MEAGLHPDDPALAALAGELSVRDPDFRTWWGNHQVRGPRQLTKTYHHPVAGTLTLSSCPSTPSQTSSWRPTPRGRIPPRKKHCASSSSGPVAPPIRTTAPRTETTTRPRAGRDITRGDRWGSADQPAPGAQIRPPSPARASPRRSTPPAAGSHEVGATTRCARRPRGAAKNRFMSATLPLVLTYPSNGPKPDDPGQRVGYQGSWLAYSGTDPGH